MKLLKYAQKKIKTEEHLLILFLSLIISICLYILLFFLSPITFKADNIQTINWFSINQYPKQMDYIYLEFGYVFIILVTVLLWLIKIWSKSQKHK